jgi:hypothetical protein
VSVQKIRKYVTRAEVSQSARLLRGAGKCRVVHRSRRRRTTTQSLRIFCRHSIRCWRVMDGVRRPGVRNDGVDHRLRESRPPYLLQKTVFVAIAGRPCRATGEFSTYGNKPVRRERTMQRAFAEYDDIIQTLAANGPDEPFDIGPLPRRSRRQ